MVMDLVQFTLQKLLFVHGLRQYPVLHSFPTRRSSDLSYARHRLGEELATGPAGETGGPSEAPLSRAEALDRKSTRLNSSHVASSYAVFCLKKNNMKQKKHQ